MSASGVARTIVFVGGDAKYTLDFRSSLIGHYVEHGCRVVILATPNAGFDAGRVTALGAEFIPWSLSNVGFNPLHDVRAVAELWRTLRALRPDLVFAHMLKPVCYAMPLARLAGSARRAAMIPGLGYAFSNGSGWRRRLTRWMAQWMYRLSLPSAGIVIFQNPDDLALFREHKLLPRRTPVGVVGGSGVDLRLFPQVPLPEGPVTFLLVARLLWDKGVGEFVEAARIARGRQPDLRFVLVGAPGSNPASINPEDFVRWREEGVIEVRGHMADPQSAYAESHVFVLPSYYREGIPRSNLEALATGRAIVTTDLPGCRETVKPGENGLIVPPRSAEALAEAMLELAADRDRLVRMGAASRRLCESRFELARVTRDTIGLLELQPVDGKEMRQP